MTPSAPVVRREVMSEVQSKLDATEKLAPGRGQLDLGAFVRGQGDTGVAGAQLDYQHRLTPTASIFGNAAAGYGYGTVGGLDYQATAGLRLRF